MSDIWLGKYFFDAAPNTRPIKEKFDKLDSSEFKNLCSLNDTVKRMKRQIIDLEKISVYHLPEKGFLSRIVKIS